MYFNERTKVCSNTMNKETETLQWTERVNQERVDSLYLKNFGERYTKYRKLWKEANAHFLPDFPVNLDVEVIDACNLNCRYCFRDKQIAEKNDFKVNTGKRFPLESFERIMNEAAQHSLQAVNFGFLGECLLNPDLIKMINMASLAGILDIRLITNGTLVDFETANKLLDSPLTLLSFSIDAGTAETYKAIKGKDYFAQLLNTVKYIHTRKKELGKDLPLIRASFYPSPESAGEREEFLSKFEPYVDFVDFQRFQNLRGTEKKQIKINCRSPFCRMAIFANGDVAPCCNFFSKKLIAGNINNMTLGEIWNSKAMQEIRKGLVGQNPLEVCKRCLGLFREGS